MKHKFVDKKLTKFHKFGYHTILFTSLEIILAYKTKENDKQNILIKQKKYHS